MGNRLSRIYTRTGDNGETGLADGRRIAKDALRIQVYGELDELNSHVGLVLAHLEADDELAGCLHEIQHLLFDLGGDLCIPGRHSLEPRHVEWLEAWLDHYNDNLPPLRDFVLPGGNVPASAAHLARTVCRRVERSLVTLGRVDDMGPLAIPFINRLSDFLFVSCRVLARRSGGLEVMWQPGRPAAAWPPR